MTDRPTPVVQHLLITRFAVRFRNQPPPTAAWIAERFALLERFTAPSVRNQTLTDFTWWMQCDVSTDQGVVDRLRAVMPQVRVALLGTPEPGVPVAEADARGWSVQNHVRPETTILVQSRLDSDDILHPAYLADVDADVGHFLAHGGVEWLRVAAEGYHYDSRCRAMEVRLHVNGSFQSYYCRVGPDLPARPMPGDHTRAPLAVWGYAALGRPSWIRVIHGGNVLNRLHGNLPSADPDVVGREFCLPL